MSENNNETRGDLGSLHDATEEELEIFERQPKHRLLQHVLWQAFRQADDWARFPENRQEIWAAAANAFGAAPEGENEIARYLQSPAGLAARQEFSFSGPLPDQVTRHMQRMAREDRLSYFRNDVPEAYGMLLEGFGDPEGLQKMRMDRPPKWAYPPAPWPNPLPKLTLNPPTWTQEDLELMRGLKIDTRQMNAGQSILAGTSFKRAGNLPEDSIPDQGRTQA